MNKVTRVVLWAVVAMAVPALAWAGGQKEGTAGSAAGTTPAMTAGPGGYPAYTGQAANITMWAWTSNENYSIDAFQKAYPNITVKWDNFGVDYSKILTATAAGKGLPDVIMSEYTYAPQFMEYGSFQPINKWVPQSLYLKYFPANTLKWTSMEGKIYGTPQDSGAMTMVYRKDVLDKYGLSVPKTWEEFASEAVKLHNADPNVWMTTMPRNWILWPMGMVWEAGGKLFDYANGKWYIDFTNPIAEKVFNYWGKLISDGAIKFDMYWTADWYKELDQGLSATVISGGWFPEWLQLNSKASAGKWRVAVPPQWDASNPQNGEMGGSGFYVSSQSTNAEAAALFVLWLNSNKESLIPLHDKSQLPILWSKVFTNEVAPSLANIEYPYFGGQKITPVSVDAMNLVKTSFTSLPVMDFVQSSMETGLEKVDKGQMTMSQFLQEWQDNVVAFMKKQGFNNLVVGELPSGD